MGLTDKPLKVAMDDDRDLTVGLAYANCLAGGNSSDPLRALTLAMKLKDAEEIELEKTDIEFLTTAVKSFDGYKDLVRGQLLKLLV